MIRSQFYLIAQCLYQQTFGRATGKCFPAVGALMCLPWLAYAESGEDKKVAELEERINQLEQLLEQRVDVLADAIDAQQAEQSSPIHFGGYGEMHYNLLNHGGDGDDVRELDFHRFVLFIGYDFSDRIRLHSEFEVEHVIASAGNRGAVELEQAYIEFDLTDHRQLQGGLMLVPIGLTNETHEPPTFYGVERPVVETTVIPTTWYVNAVNLRQRVSGGWQFDFMISEGLKTEDPNAQADAEPFNLKAGKQKGSFSSAYDLAYTGRVSYSGISGLTVSAYAQYQPDLDQSAEESYAEAATLIGGHVVYQVGSWQLKALAAQWQLDGDAAESAGKDAQFGAYAELSWQPWEQLGIFARHSGWSLEDGVDNQQTNFGLNYYPHEDVVFKVDAQLQNEEAGDLSGLNLGLGYQF